MLNVDLIRVVSGEFGTFGILKATGLELVTLEPPWKDNILGLSCIPDGDYPCECMLSPKFGWTYGLRAVPERTNILFHTGNYGGDRTKGHRSDTYGCILPGMKTGLLNEQPVILRSRLAFGEMQLHFKGQPLRLTIRSMFNGPSLQHRKN